MSPIKHAQQPGPDIASLEKVLGLPLSSSDKQIGEIAREMCDLKRKLIVVIGAGFSFENMTITTELKPFLASFLKRMNMKDPVGMITNDDDQAWKEVRNNSKVFIDMFSGYTSAKTPLPQHEILASLFHDGKIAEIISFNWDQLLEEAFREKFGSTISKI